MTTGIGQPAHGRSTIAPNFHSLRKKREVE
jgi:hypothetical protein